MEEISKVKEEEIELIKDMSTSIGSTLQVTLLDTRILYLQRLQTHP
jgi:hypothetical protein